MRTLTFTGPESVTVTEEPTPVPDAGEVLVRTDRSAISPGTELLVYRGEAPTEVRIDESIDALSGTLSYPLRYGYACVGTVIDVGESVDEAWLDRDVFAFHPHASHFVSAPDALQPIPDGCSREAATFLPNVEAAVNFLMDARPTIGERVVVIGQGVVGLLTTALLARYPLDRLVTIDRHERRRDCSRSFGADESLDPRDHGMMARIDELLGDRSPSGADVTIELTGNPEAIDVAVDVTGYSGRVVIGSWYGTKRARLNLGGSFHRSRIRLVSSQVSTIDPAYTGRFSKARRFAVAWEHLQTLDLDRLVTHRISIERAADAYRLLDEEPDTAVGVILEYD